MKKSLVLFFGVAFLLLSSSIFAQSSSSKYGWLAKDSWSFGFGGTYPRYISTSVTVQDEAGYGGFLSIQKNFSEHIGLRLLGNYLHFQGFSGAAKIENNSIAGNFDLIYYFVPCEPISPYLGVGVGLFSNTIKNSPQNQYNKSFLDYQMNLNFGSEWRIGENWKLKTELGYHTVASGHFDGTGGTANGGILGGLTDAYMNFDLGFLYYFGYGEKSNLCDMYEGIGKVDYSRIEDIVKKYQAEPTEVDYNRIENIVKKYQSQVKSGQEENWVLIGVNFDFNKATLRPESYPILYNAAELLLTHPDSQVEIQGYTDNIGSEKYNQKLSERRAETVKNFLVAKGVDASRLKTVGYGESKPIMDNKTADGRALNRRIEFQVKNK